MTARHCARCGHGPLQPQSAPDTPWPDRHHGRGLCAPCHEAAGRDGTLLDWPRNTRASADLVEDAELWRRRDPQLTWRQIAVELGVSYAALDKARQRMRAKTAGEVRTGRFGKGEPARMEAA